MAQLLSQHRAGEQAGYAAVWQSILPFDFWHRLAWQHGPPRVRVQKFLENLLLDEKPLLFHTGPRKLFPLVSEQIKKVIALEQLRYIAFSHVEADECGALPAFLAAAPQARPVCSDIAAMVSMNDLVDVEPIGMSDGQVLETGRHRLTWQTTPHLPHGWECGYLFDELSRTHFCGDLFTQPGTGEKALVHDDIVESSVSLGSGLYLVAAHGRYRPDPSPCFRPSGLPVMDPTRTPGAQ